VNKKHFSFFTITIFFVLLHALFVHASFAGVIVYDSVSSKNNSVRLKALTKGRFFSQGGTLVEFYIDKKHVGRTLSGGDGYAFLKYQPLSPGIKHLKAKAGIDEDEGILLVIKEKDRVVLIDIESALFENIFLLEPEKKSRDAVYKLSKRFRIIYTTSLLGVRISRNWLHDNDFFTSAVLTWRGPGLLTELQTQGVKPYAIIGSPEIISATPDIKKKFSFKDTEDGTVVKDWDELLKGLQ
jgi:hypothetical protein